MAAALVFRNVRILDGTGAPWLVGDVAVEGSQILAVGDVDGIESAGVRTIEDDPKQEPVGVDCVVVNGAIVYEDAVHTGDRPGALLRHRAETVA